MSNNPFLVKIVRSVSLCDDYCPSCGANLVFRDWNTVDGKPQDGKYTAECPACSEEFKLEVRTTTNYRTM